MTRSIVILGWQIRCLLARLSPDGLLLAVLRWCIRIGLLIAIPLGVVIGLLLLIGCGLAAAGAVLTSGIGIGLIVLGLVILVIRLAR